MGAVTTINEVLEEQCGPPHVTARPDKGINPLGVSLWVINMTRDGGLCSLVTTASLPTKQYAYCIGSQTWILEPTEEATMVQTRGQERRGFRGPAGQVDCRSINLQHQIPPKYIPHPSSIKRLATIGGFPPRQQAFWRGER